MFSGRQPHQDVKVLGRLGNELCWRFGSAQTDG